jgi:ectoine hydroxylase
MRPRPLREALDRVHAVEAVAGALALDGSMHLLSAAVHCPDLAGLIDHPTTFGHVWPVPGWTIHIFHSHLDVHPPIQVPMPFRFNRHQDGGRQNREIETTPRPGLSAKLAYRLSDVSQPGRATLTRPGQPSGQLDRRAPRRDIDWPDPEGAIEVTAAAGDAVFFDRRIRHTRSRNHSPHTRKAVFFGYTYRWAAIRDDITPIRASSLLAQLSPVQQFLGVLPDTGGDHVWGHDPTATPLYSLLKEQAFLGLANPPLRP